MLLVFSNQKNQIFIILAEACNEWRSPSPQLSAWATQLRKKDAAVANRWRHCVDLTGLGIEPQTSRTDSVRLATDLTAGYSFSAFCDIVHSSSLMRFEHFGRGGGFLFTTNKKFLKFLKFDFENLHPRLLRAPPLIRRSKIETIAHGVGRVVGALGSEAGFDAQLGHLHDALPQKS